MNRPTTAMIMAAGMGTRMMPLTLHQPKPLVEVGGVKLIDHVLDHLREAGIGQIVVNVHYRADQMDAHLAEAAFDFDCLVSDERALLRDTGGGLIKALPLIQSDPFFCINADNWWVDGTANALTSLAKQWDDQRMDVLMLLVPLEKAHNSKGQGDFHCDREGRLERRQSIDRPLYVWTGIQILAKRLITNPPADVFSTNVFWDRAIAEGRCFGSILDGQWFDVGYPEAIGATEAMLARG